MLRSSDELGARDNLILRSPDVKVAQQGAIQANDRDDEGRFGRLIVLATALRTTESMHNVCTSDAISPSRCATSVAECAGIQQTGRAAERG